jgi:hypothetical protein
MRRGREGKEARGRVAGRRGGDERRWEGKKMGEEGWREFGPSQYFGQIYARGNAFTRPMTINIRAGLALANKSSFWMQEAISMPHDKFMHRQL